jgi:sulfatase maturation enzyme AslB (radical SAM superfamily)
MTDQAIVPWAFQVMVKPRGAICNLGCEYCYYLPKEEILRIMASLLRQGRALRGRAHHGRKLTG